MKEFVDRFVDRRNFLRGLAATTAAVALNGLLPRGVEACGGSTITTKFRIKAVMPDGSPAPDGTILLITPINKESWVEQVLPDMKVLGKENGGERWLINEGHTTIWVQDGQAKERLVTITDQSNSTRGNCRSLEVFTRRVLGLDSEGRVVLIRNSGRSNLLPFPECGILDVTSRCDEERIIQPPAPPAEEKPPEKPLVEKPSAPKPQPVPSPAQLPKGGGGGDPEEIDRCIQANIERGLSPSPVCPEE